MLLTVILACLALMPDEAPKSKPRPAAMVIDLEGKVEIRPSGSPTRAAEVGDLLYPGECLAVPGGGSATLSILGAGARESIKPGTEATVGLKGCIPPESVASRKDQPRAVATTMKGLRPTPGDGRKAGVGFRGDPERSLAITPISGTTVVVDRPSLAWPSEEKIETYRVKLLSGAGRELWKVETKVPRLDYPVGKEPLQAGFVYRWEVTDQDFRKVAHGEFTAATDSERMQLDELKPLASSGDRADRRSAALAYRRLAAYAEAIAVSEGLVRQSPADPTDRRALAGLYRLAGRPQEADEIQRGKKSDTR